MRTSLTRHAISPWFIYYVVEEVIYQLPTCISSIKGLWNRDRVTPLYIVCYSMQALVLRGLYNVEIMSWTHLSKEEKSSLLWLHAPGVLLLAWMGTDMISRVKNALLEQKDVEHSTKRP